MARGENPGKVISVKTTLTYSATTDFGHASAGKDLALSLNESGGDAGKGKLAGDNERIVGKFLDLDKDKEASVLLDGHPIILRKSAAAIAPGSKVVGAGNGKIKAAGNDAAGNANGRGYVLEVLETGDNGRVKVILPA